MLQLILRRSYSLTLLLATSFAFAQSEFSADVVHKNAKEDRSVSKVYFGKDKMRFDSPQDQNKDQGMGAFILDLTNESYIVLMAKQHMYMEMPSQAMESRGLFSFFKSGNVDNACPDWLKISKNKGGTCHKVGSEIVNGRSTVKYEGTNAEGEKSTMWLDSKVRFPIKWEDKNSGGELRNIQEGAQPASLFQIPPGYTKMDLGGMKRPQH